MKDLQGSIEYGKLMWSESCWLLSSLCNPSLGTMDNFKQRICPRNLKANYQTLDYTQIVCAWGSRTPRRIIDSSLSKVIALRYRCGTVYWLSYWGEFWNQKVVRVELQKRNVLPSPFWSIGKDIDCSPYLEDLRTWSPVAP